MERRFEPSDDEDCQRKCKKQKKEENDLGSMEEQDCLDTQTTKPTITDFISEANISNLPPEVLLHIFSFLPKEELLIIDEVCHEWEQLCQEDSLWKHMTIDISAVSRDVLCSLLRNAEDLRSLNLVGSGLLHIYNHPRHYVEEAFEQVCRSNHNLETVNINIDESALRGSISFTYIVKLVRACENMKNFTIKGLSVTFDKFYDVDGLLWPKLQYAAFHNFFGYQASLIDEDKSLLSYFSKMSETLESLCMVGYSLNDKEMDEITKCINLKSLEIRFGSDINDGGIIRISELHNLTSLSILYNHDTDMGTWIDLFGHPSMSRLKYLKMNSVRNFNDLVLDVIKTNCLNITQMKISGCEFVTPPKLFEVVNTCSNLRVIDYKPFYSKMIFRPNFDVVSIQ